VRGDLLRLELTESTLLERPDSAALQLRRLRDHGVKVAIDDFGTGYSSLRYLHQLPIDTLKVDRSFVTGIEVESEQRQIVRTIVMLAHALGKDVVAEGVENSAQLEQLRKLDCEFAQGYLFAEPLPPGLAEQFVRNH
jgi:EAL domain-containing protein (putative c-di-GMP-specific phosphodiesterase class I)